MSSKQERYFSGRPLVADPRRPLPGEVPPGRKRRFVIIGAAVVILGLGVLVGLWVAPEPPATLEHRVAELEGQLAASRAEVAELERTLAYRETDKPLPAGKLKPADRKRHVTEGRGYVKALRQVKAQPAAQLMEWFIPRWNDLLDHPEPDDRVGRRAAVLSLLVGGMAQNLHPDDYVPWQAEFFMNAKWLGELHFDLDGDGLPAKRSSPNPGDGFAAVSVCHVAMALNQSVTDAQILVMPDLRCELRQNRMSVFLQGATLDAALDEFVRAVKREGFLVVERQEKGIRLILVGSGSRGELDEE